MAVIISIPSKSIYTDLYALSGFPFGSSLIITNVSSSPLFVVQSLSQPAADFSGNAFPTLSGETTIVHGDLQTTWIRGGPGPIVVQLLATTIMPLTGVELPHDVYTNKIEGRRRPKISSEPSIAAAVLNGFGHTISGSFSVADGTYLAMNISPASDIIIHKIVTNTNLGIEVYNALATGTADGIFSANNMSMLSVDISPTTGQLFSAATAVGGIIAAGTSILEPYVIAGLNKKVAVVVRNTTGSTATVKITVTFEEIGPRASTFGLTASTELTPTTEMSTFG